MKNSFDIGDYQMMQDKNLNCWLFMVVIFFVTLGILFILYKFEFSVYEKLNLIKDNDQFLIVIDSKKISAIEEIEYVYINNNKYRFDINKVSIDYTNVDDSIYQTVYINLYNYKTDALITDGYILKSKKTIYELIIEYTPERVYILFMNTIGKYIKQERRKAGLTQEEFAVRSGLGLRFVRELEQGKETVRLDKVNQALRMFGMQAVPGKLVDREE